MRHWMIGVALVIALLCAGDVGVAQQVAEDTADEVKEDEAEATAEAAVIGEADGVTAQCLARDLSAEICACATTLVAEQASERDFRLYEQAGREFMARVAAGDELETSYNAIMAAMSAEHAIAEEELRGVMGEVGNVQRRAINRCDG